MKSSKGEGTKIAQAAKDLNVTSVTIRRYISEFNIETTSDENGIKVLPEVSMEELHEIRRLKEDGLTNPKVLETLEEMREKRASEPPKKKAEPKKTAKRVAAEPAKKEPAKKVVERKSAKKEEVPAAPEEDDEEEEEEAPPPRPVRRASRVVREPEPVVEPEAEEEEEAPESPEGAVVELAADGRSKHSLTCQTCGKVFEHMNPRLRDCLDCYRAKRKERRRGGDKHKNVIQHPIAQQVANKQQARNQSGDDMPLGTIDVSPSPVIAPVREATPLPLSSKRVNPLAGMHRAPVRNYRKAIEETRQITANLKRRLERPDLPENERRWLEQIYAYQLILHQGWRHLAEYKAGNPPNREAREGVERSDRLERPDRAERGDRPERGDRLDRGDRPERGDRFDRGDRPERGERGGDRNDRNRGDRDRGDRDRGDRERTDRPDRDRNDRD